MMSRARRHRTFPIALILALSLPTGFPPGIVGTLTPAPSGGAASEALPLRFGWGRTYEDLRHILSGGGTVLEDRPGELFRLQSGDGWQIHYRFYRDEKIGDIIVTERETEAGKRAVLKELVLEPVGPPADAVLYAAEILLPGLPLDPPPGEGRENALMQRLTENYGTPARSERPRGVRKNFAGQPMPEEGKPEATVGAYLELERDDTLVRVYYRIQGGRRFAVRLSFASIRLSRERNRNIEKVRKEADRAIRRKIDAANRRLQRAKS